MVPGPKNKTKVRLKLLLFKALKSTLLSFDSDDEA